MMLKKVQDYISQHHLFTSQDTILAGVSGGVDSVVLIRVLHTLGYKCMIVHCNFHLRGEESDRDALFVKSLACELHIPLRTVDFETEKYALEKKISIEMAARELRYTWFKEVADKEKTAHIAIAHHADDVVETFMINLIRGTGIHGLTGIKPKNGDIVRPLLCLSRDEIITFARQKGFSYVEDSTNKENIYTRNKIRNQIIPLLQTVNPSFSKAILHTIQNLHHTEIFLEDKLEDTFKYICKKEPSTGSYFISIEKLQKEKSPYYILFELLYPYGFTPSVIQDVTDGLDGISGKQYFAEKYKIIKDRENLILTPIHSYPVTARYTIEATDLQINEPVNLSVTYQQNNSQFVLNKDKRFCYLDADKVTFPLEIRKWQEGDMFFPFGMKNKKKISDYFIDRHFSLLQKENAWLLTSHEKIVWIIGERSDDRFKITPETKKIMILELNK